MEIHKIATIHTDFPSKFGIPRQSGLVPELKGEIVFEPEYRQPEAFRGLEGFSHLWLVWEFSKAKREHWSATVKPPRLGGNERMGVFATRSPFRPNPLGLSCVKLETIRWDEEKGPILVVSGVDLMDQTPIYDVKPYLPYADCKPDATSGFVDSLEHKELEVEIPEEWLEMIPVEKRDALYGVLAQDPRPSYQNDPERRYGIYFDQFDVRFHVVENRLTVCEIEQIK